MIQYPRAPAASREQLEANPCLRLLTPFLVDPKPWHWSRRKAAPD